MPPLACVRAAEDDYEAYAAPARARAPPAVSRPAARASISTGTKVMITNLDPEIEAEDLREVFASEEVLGKRAAAGIKSVSIHMDANGNSKETGEVVFRRRQDALLAIEELDGRDVDGRVIRVRLVGSWPPALAVWVCCMPCL